MEKVLVTGGTGYIGSHTVVELITAGYEVEILDNLYNSKIEVLDAIQKITGVKPKFYEVDLRNDKKLDEVFRDNNFDVVMHFAGLKAVAESVEKPLDYYENNIGGTLNLLKSMQKYQVKRLIFSSSATVYGKQDSPKYVETMRTGTNLANPYGRTKYMIEEIIKDVAAADPEFSSTLLRYFNPIGAHESGLIFENPNDKPNNLMPIMLKAAKEQTEFTIFGNDYATPDGTCIRDYAHVVDIAKGHLKAMEHMTPGTKIYNLGTGKGTSVLEMVRLFVQAHEENLPYKVAPRRAGDLAEYYADPSLAEQELGWKATHTVAEAVESAVKAYFG